MKSDFTRKTHRILPYFEHPLLHESILGKVFISAADHAVELNLDENGVEGSAVMAFRGEFRSLRRTRNVDIDRPFYFTISTRCYHNELRQKWKCPYENTPIFIGKVVTPFADQ